MKGISLTIGAALGLFALAATDAWAQTPPNRDDLAAKEIKPLDSAALARYLTGNTLYHIVPANGFKVPIHYRADGTRVVKMKGRETESRWRIERDMICEDSVFLNREVCRLLFVIEEPKGVVCEEGQAACSNLTDRAIGNPEGLGR